MVAESKRQEIGSLVKATVFKVFTAGAESWAQTELTMPQLKVLLLLGQQGKAPVSWLATRMKVSPPNITGILDRLEQRGWVARTNDPLDRRVVRIVLTKEGDLLLHDLCAAGVGDLQGRLDGMPEESAQALHRGFSMLLEPDGARRDQVDGTDGVSAT